MSLHTYDTLESGQYASTIDWNGRDPKKDFNFVWSLQLPKYKFSKIESLPTSNYANYKKDVDDVFGLPNNNAESLGVYVSQLAQKVDLPSTQLDELSDYHYGELETNVPYGMKYEDIQVSYIEDEFDTIYTMHYNWLAWISKHKYPKYLMCGKGTYISLGVDRDKHELTRKSKSTYANIYPKSISRTSADKGGSGLGGVTVVYGQYIIPKLDDSLTDVLIK